MKRQLLEELFYQSKELQINSNGNLANFFSYVCNGKNIKELFASTVNGITASVRCVSSIIVFLNAKSTTRRMQTKKYSEKRTSPKRVLFLLVETQKHLTSIAVLTLYTFQRSMKANRNINLWQEKAPISRLSRSKAPKTHQIRHYKHTRRGGRA